MTNKVQSFFLALAIVLGLGMSVPSCPGQKEMEERVSTLEKLTNDLTKRNQVLESQLKTAESELTQIKTLLEEITKNILDQKQTVEKLDQSVQEALKKAVPARGKPPVKGRK